MLPRNAVHWCDCLNPFHLWQNRNQFSEAVPNNARIVNRHQTSDRREPRRKDIKYVRCPKGCVSQSPKRSSQVQPSVRVVELSDAQGSASRFDAKNTDFQKEQK